MKKIFITLIGIFIIILFVFPILVRAADIKIKEDIKVEAKTGGNVIKNGNDIKIETGQAQAKIDIKTKIGDQDLEPFVIDLEEGEIEKEVYQELNGITQEIEAEVKVEKGEFNKNGDEPNMALGTAKSQQEEVNEEKPDKEPKPEKNDKIEKPAKGNGVLNFFEILRRFFMELGSWFGKWF